MWSWSGRLVQKTPRLGRVLGVGTGDLVHKHHTGGTVSVTGGRRIGVTAGRGDSFVVVFAIIPGRVPAVVFLIGGSRRIDQSQRPDDLEAGTPVRTQPPVRRRRR